MRVQAIDDVGEGAPCEPSRVICRPWRDLRCIRTCISESTVDFELPRCRSMARPFPLRLSVADPVI